MSYTKQKFINSGCTKGKSTNILNPVFKKKRFPSILTCPKNNNHVTGHEARLSLSSRIKKCRLATAACTENKVSSAGRLLSIRIIHWESTGISCESCGSGKSIRSTVALATLSCHNTVNVHIKAISLIRAFSKAYS